MTLSFRSFMAAMATSSLLALSAGACDTATPAPVPDAASDTVQLGDADGVTGDIKDGDAGPGDISDANDTADAGDANDVDPDGPADADADDIAIDAELPPVADADAEPTDASDDADTALLDPCDPTGKGITRDVNLPLGETLFFDNKGDDYLAFWGANHPCPVGLDDQPSTSTADFLGAVGARRFTPDITGVFTFRRGPDTAKVSVITDSLDEDTFINLNYSPNSPLALRVLIGDGEDPSELWVATPTSNAVQRVILGTGDAEPTAQELIPTGSWPTSLAYLPGSDTFLVTQAGRDTLGFLDASTRTLVDAIRVGNAPMDIQLIPTGTDIGGAVAGTQAWITLSDGDAVARVDLASRAVITTLPTGRKPRAMIWSEAHNLLIVASSISSNAHPMGLVQDDNPLDPASQRDLTIIDLNTDTILAIVPELGTINRGLWIDPANPNRLLVTTTHADNLIEGVDADSRPHHHQLVEVDIDPESPTAWTVTSTLDLDEQPSSGGAAASPFTMLPSVDGKTLVVTLSAGRALLHLDPTTLEEVARGTTGHDPRGLVQAGGRLWTYAWLDDQIEGHGPLMIGSLPIIIPIGNDKTPEDVREGQRIFNDAAFSKHNDFSCNNCHIDGLTDGLTWDLLLDGPVNTISFRNVGGTGPFLWGGTLPTLFDFSREVLKLVGADASGAQMDVLTRYMQSVSAPPNPYSDPGGALTEAGINGEVVFTTSAGLGGGGCADCHTPPLYSIFSVVEGKTDDLPTDVPALLSVYDSGPWGREGDWTTLESKVDRALEFTDASISGEDREDLLAFVRQIPGDLLYITSAKPLNGAKYVWNETDIELGFSHALAAGQEGLFSIAVTDSEGTTEPLPGAWALSGRVARFTPLTPLPLDSDFSVTVTGGLTAVFGQNMNEALTVAFGTGGVPDFDTSGNWSMELSEANFGTIPVDVAVLQTPGGKLTGVLLSEFDEGELDFIEGVVTGDLLILDPFYIQSVIGPLYVDKGFESVMVDADGDGFAESGTGLIEFTLGKTYFIDVKWTRTSLPK